MDLARRTYTTWVRPFRDSGQPVQIRWYRVPREWGTLPFPSAINSIDWLTEPLLKTGVGEIPGADRKFLFSRPPAGGPFGDHTCGTAEDFALGEVYDPSRPANVYGANGLPVCCQVDRRPPINGGLEFNGSADIRVTQPPSDGGLEINGSAEITITQPESMTGGIEMGGSAEITITQPPGCGGPNYWFESTSGGFSVELTQLEEGIWIAFGPFTLTTDCAGNWALEIFGTLGYVTTGWDGTGSRVFDPVPGFEPTTTVHEGLMPPP